MTHFTLLLLHLLCRRCRRLFTEADAVAARFGDICLACSRASCSCLILSGFRDVLQRRRRCPLEAMSQSKRVTSLCQQPESEEEEEESRLRNRHEAGGDRRKKGMSVMS